MPVDSFNPAMALPSSLVERLAALGRVKPPSAPSNAPARRRKHHHVPDMSRRILAQGMRRS
jgi:hypothetical protein